MGKTILNTGGSLGTAKMLINKYGLVMEGDFIPKEKNKEMSIIQEKALRMLNKLISKGEGIFSPQFSKNKKEREKEAIKTLNEIFGKLTKNPTFDINDFKKDAIKSSSFTTGYYRQREVSLRRTFNKWTAISYEEINIQFPGPGNELRRKRKKRKMLRKVIRALNDHHPVLMAVYVEFTGLKKGVFSLKKLHEAMMKSRWKPDGGLHLLVLEDYKVDLFNSSNEFEEEIGYGEYDEDVKSDIIKRFKKNRAEITEFMAKNSWGSQRNEAGIKDGFTRFTMKYLDNVNPKVMGEKFKLNTFVGEFIIPKKYDR